MIKKEMFSVENGKIIKNGNRIFEDLSLRLFQGEITGIVFDNILGQKVFLEFLSGDLLLEAGRVYVEERRETFQNAARQTASFTAVIGTRSKLVESITIEENIFLFSDRRKFLNQKLYRDKFQELRRQFQCLEQIPHKVRNLTAKEKVMVELLKAYVEEKRVVVLDEIASSLPQKDLDEVFELICKMKHKMTFVITIGFEETVIKWSDSFVVVQNGKTIYMTQTQVLNKKLNQVLKALLNEPQPQEQAVESYTSTVARTKKNMLQVKDGSTGYLQGLNLSLRAGEVLNIYYGDEESREHFWGMLAGEVPLRSGRILLDGQMYAPRSMSQAVAMGMGFVTEAPYRTMMMENLSVLENLSLPLHEKVRGFWMQSKYASSVAESLRGLHLKEKTLKNVSNADLQKIAYEKWMLYLPKVLLVENPFSDMDVNMREITIERIENLQKRGISIIILTSNFSTMHKIKGRALYLQRGRILEEGELWDSQEHRRRIM